MSSQDGFASGGLDRLRDKWDALTPQKKTFCLKWGSGSAILLAILLSYYWSGRSERVVEEVVEVVKQPQTQPVSVETSELSKQLEFALQAIKNINSRFAG